MSAQILPAQVFELHPEPEPIGIIEDARNIVTWLSVPGVAERYGILDVAYIVCLFNMLINSCTPQEAAGDISALIDYVKFATRAEV